MSNFRSIKDAVADKLDQIKDMDLFTTDVSKDELWATYLESFPEGTNPIYRERTEHDCNCCKQFIRDLGKVVAIVDNQLVSIWDIEVGGFYQVVADAMSALVKSRPISGVFLSSESKAGTDYNYEIGTHHKWEHFYYELPASVIVRKQDIGTQKAAFQANEQVFRRSMEDITLDAAETVLDLIAQNSLYRGQEHKRTIQQFTQAKRKYAAVPQDERAVYCWSESKKLGPAGRFKNTVIGTLLAAISEGMDLDAAVRSFESKVAPANYKRPKALITPAMISKAQEKVAELGLENALPRRYAVAEDLTINNVIFADRSVKPAMNVFEELASEATLQPKKFDKVEEVPVGQFMEAILPTAKSIELLVENRHVNNLVSLIAPVHAEVNPIFKWDNNFSWAYAGEVTDSIKERVKKAGGNVDGVLRCSLSWFNYDDLDIRVIEPCGNRISFASKKNPRTSGQLDVDMNAGYRESREAVENITWTDQTKMREGTYKVIVHNYSLRETVDVGFEVEIDYLGETYHFSHPEFIGNDNAITVAEFKYTQSKGIEFINTISSTQVSKEAWGIATNNFHKVTMVMNSPNHWDEEETGNKHWFFMLDGCTNPDPARGFFNEFLRGELTEHRKVFEVLGNKMKTPLAENQLSGLGFSSTQTNSVTCRITGTFNRIIKVIF